MTKKVLLVAPVLTKSGYGVHSRQVAQYLFHLLDQGADFQLDINPINCGTSPYYLNKSDPLIDRIYKHAQRNNFEYDVSIQIQMPSPREWNPNIAKTNIGITAGVETDICHPQWLSTINAMTHVIVPSNYTKSTFTKSSDLYKMPLTTPVSVVKEFVSDVYYNPATGRDVLESIKTDFNIFVFGQITGLDRETDRKNLFLSLQTLFAAYHNNPNVGIIVKANLGRETDLDQSHVKTILGQIKEATCDFTSGQKAQPKLYCLHGVMSEEELNNVYRSPKVKALYTTTRGEAVGLPIVEAAAAELPVIAPSLGGHTEYLEDGKWLKIPSKYENLPEKKIDAEVFAKGASWIETNPQEAIVTLRKFYEKNSKPKEWAKSQSQSIQKKLAKTVIFSEYDKVLKQYLV